MGEFIVWVIIHYSKANMTMYEFDTEKEARETFKNIQGSSKILSEVIYFNDNRLQVATI
jgi:desulfoferrodoxin (superoxide reductase-like protein)